MWREWRRRGFTVGRRLAPLECHSCSAAAAVHCDRERPPFFNSLEPQHHRYLMAISPLLISDLQPSGELALSSTVARQQPPSPSVLRLSVSSLPRSCTRSTSTSC
ncbi:hypothetical protein BRADI_2g32906v3 [Brachypodium distachyon]|uniref:Uncharacterized protein n=1 Tax=Brachypodium distachyon TaxID=15368 RepID=A0A2K2DBJ4_BRADI|nr:hypothetical protein BRADI_2g32906v3 [Brachypodium distachyon]